MGRPNLGGVTGEPPKDNTPTYEVIGVTKKEASEAQILAELPEEEKEKV